MAGNRKKLILLILLPIIIAVAIGYYMYNRGPVDIADEKGIPVEAATLYELYSKDSASANLQYTDKILEVTGVVSGSSDPSAGQMAVLIASGAEGANINCSLADSAVTVPAVGSKITIKGICTGIQPGDPDMGIPGDVILSRCTIMKK